MKLYILLVLNSVLLYPLTCFGTVRNSPTSPSYTNLISERKNCYSAGSYKKIIVLTPPRTGSTLLFNVARTLFEKPENKNKNGYLRKKNSCFVQKSHNFSTALQPDVLYLCSYRDPYAIINSRLACRGVPIKACQKHATIVGTYFRLIQSLQKKTNVLFLKYESFSNSFDYIFENLEKTCNITIHPYDKKLIAKTFSKKNVLEFSKSLNGFGKRDKISHIHGKHITTGILSESEVKTIRRLSTPVLKLYENEIGKFGYTLDSN